MLPLQEILPWQFALSKGRRLLKEDDIDAGKARLPGLLRHFLYDHLAYERNGDAAHAMDDLLRTGDIGPRQVRTMGELRCWRVFARFRNELLQTQRNVIGYPLLQMLGGLGHIELLVLKLLREFH
jgi:hypothetical protein